MSQTVPVESSSKVSIVCITLLSTVTDLSTPCFFPQWKTVNFTFSAYFDNGLVIRY